MAYNNLNDWTTSICDAIREKEGSSDLIPAPDIPERIRGIKSGGDAPIFQTSSMGIANSGTDITNILQTEVTAENMGYVDYVATYGDTSPYEKIVPVNQYIYLSGFAISASKLFRRGSVTISVKYKDSEEYVTVISDTSSTQDVWSGTDNTMGGAVSYNREYTFDGPSNISAIKVVMTDVYRCSFTMHLNISE